jgi:hypothetical protein
MTWLKLLCFLCHILETSYYKSKGYINSSILSFFSGGGNVHILTVQQ